MDFVSTAQEYPAIMQAFFFMLGACMGSFLNVCAERLPKGESVVSPPSHCECGRSIEWYLNIPILSWFILRGRTKCCNRRLSFRHPFVEALTAFMFLYFWNEFPTATALALMAFACLMVFCAAVDFDTMTLPDYATIGGAALGLLASALVPDLHSVELFGAPAFARSTAGVIASATGIAVGSGVVYWLRLTSSAVFGREAMGEGDVILAGAIGAFCGWQGAMFAVFGGAVIGSVLVLPYVAARRLFCRQKSNAEDGELREGIPFGPWLAAGALVYLMFLKNAVDAYFASCTSLFFGN